MGGRIIEDKLFAQKNVDKTLGVDVAAGTFASLVLTDVLAGPLLGLIIWEILIGKSLMPLIKQSGVFIVKLCVAALFRFCITSAMVIIVVLKIL